MMFVIFIFIALKKTATIFIVTVYTILNDMSCKVV